MPGAIWLWIDLIGSTAVTDELVYQSTATLARRIRLREVSSREVLDALLERVSKLDGPINSVVTIDAERAGREAAAADEAIGRDAPRGALHGVPMTVKDSWQTAGMRTTSGATKVRRVLGYLLSR